MAVTRIDLGRAATFLVPTCKLQLTVTGGDTAENTIRRFLLEQFGGYTEDLRISTGWWKSGSGEPVADENRLFTAAFKDKDRIPPLEEFIADIARDIREDCVYFTAGEDTWLVVATPRPVCDAAERAV